MQPHHLMMLNVGCDPRAGCYDPPFFLANPTLWVVAEKVPPAETPKKIFPLLYGSVYTSDFVLEKWNKVHMEHGHLVRYFRA